MYFSKFPKTFYTLDNRKTVQVVTNILLRVVFSEELKNNYSVFEEYDVEESDTPEILAYKLYGDSNLHWVILLLNDILDPRYEWPLDNYLLNKYTVSKYSNVNYIHHYEDSSGYQINGNVVLFSNNGFSNFFANSVIINNTTSGIGFVTSKANSNMLFATVTTGGFQAGQSVKLSTNASVNTNITSTITITGTPVTNILFEEQQNELKRRIKIIKPEFIQQVIKEFESKVNDING